MVHRLCKAGLVAAWLVAQIVFGQESANNAVQLAVQDSNDGTIILGGGYFDSKQTADLLRRLVGLAGGPSASLIIVPTADPHLEPAKRSGPSTKLIDYEAAAKLRFAKLGVSNVAVLHTRDRRVADSHKFTQPLQSANCVWIPGGDPRLLFEVYPNTIVKNELQMVLARGGIIAGDSAGAMLIGEGSLAPDVQHPNRLPTFQRNGLGLLPNAFVITHTNRYKAGIIEGCKKFVSAHPDQLVILIDENTAVAIQHDRIARFSESGRAGVIDGRSHSRKSVIWLSGSTQYDLQRHVALQRN